MAPDALEARRGAAEKESAVEMTNPELVIGYDKQYRPISAVCSACGEEMPKGGAYLTSTSQMVRWFTVQFEMHVERKHPKPAPVN